MTTRSRLVALLAILLMTAPAAAQQRITLPAKDRPLSLNTRTLFQVGAVEGEDYETFGFVADVAFDARGNLLVLDVTAKRIVMFDANGKFVRTIGREGGGPGEFTAPTGLAVLGTGELVVNDGFLRGTLQVFSPKGDFLRTIPLASDLGRATGRMRATSGNAIITEIIQLRQFTEGPRNLERIQLPPRSVARLTLGDSVTGRRLFNAAPLDLKMNEAKVARGGQMRVSMSMPAFEPSLLWAPLPDGGVAALNTEQYRISLGDPQGKPLRYLERAIEPRKVTEADKKRFLERQKEGAGQAVVMGFAASSGAAGARPPAGAHVAPAPSMNVSSRMASVNAEDVTWNDVVPVISALGTDSWGRLWVQRSDASQQDGPIDLIDARLQYLGTLAKQPMPRAFGPDGRVAYIERDDLDVQHVVVKQITR